MQKLAEFCLIFALCILGVVGLMLLMAAVLPPLFELVGVPR